MKCAYTTGLNNWRSGPIVFREDSNADGANAAAAGIPDPPWSVGSVLLMSRVGYRGFDGKIPVIAFHRSSVIASKGPA